MRLQSANPGLHFADAVTYSFLVLLLLMFRRLLMC